MSDENKDTAVRQYRKKPVVIEAMHIETFHDAVNAVKWIQESGGEAAIRTAKDHMSLESVVVTLEGEMRFGGGDWIIRGVGGEFYPCKADIFAMSYDEVQS